MGLVHHTCDMMRGILVNIKTHLYSNDRGRMDRDYNEEEYRTADESGHDFSEKQGKDHGDSQRYSEDRTYAEEGRYNAESPGDQRGNALMLQSNAHQSLQVRPLVPLLISFILFCV